VTARSAAGNQAAASEPELSLLPFVAHLRQVLSILTKPLRRHLTTILGTTALATVLTIS